jgi:predicted NAD/FAD-binding protein
MLDRFPCRTRLSTPVKSIERSIDGVDLTLANGDTCRYDRVVVACHADQVLDLLTDPSDEERAALGAFRYSTNVAVLHTAKSFLPRHHAARSAWNYQAPDCRERNTLGITYSLNRLHAFQSETDFCVTLNANGSVPRDAIIREMTYAHPQYDFATLTAQEALRRLSGQRRTHFAGAHLGYGFHEDGYTSAVRVAGELGLPT